MARGTWLASSVVAAAAAFACSPEAQRLAQKADHLGIGTDMARSVAVSPDGRLVAAGFAGGTVAVWDANSGARLWGERRHTDWVSGIAFSPDGKTLVAGSSDLKITMCEAQTGKLSRTLERVGGYVYGLAFTPDGAEFVSSDGPRVFKTATGEKVRQLGGGSKGSSVVLSADGRLLARGAGDQAQLWDYASGAQLFKREHTPGPQRVDGFVPSGHVRTVALSPDGSLLASGGEDARVRLWRTADGEAAGELPHEHHVYSVAFSPDGATLAVAATEILFWGVASRELLRKTPGQDGYVVHALAWFPDGKRVVSASTELRVWDAASGRQLATLKP